VQLESEDFMCMKTFCGALTQLDGEAGIDFGCHVFVSSHASVNLTDTVFYVLFSLIEPKLDCWDCHVVDFEIHLGTKEPWNKSSVEFSWANFAKMPGRILYFIRYIYCVRNWHCIYRFILQVSVLQSCWLKSADSAVYKSLLFTTGLTWSDSVGKMGRLNKTKLVLCICC